MGRRDQVICSTAIVTTLLNSGSCGSTMNDSQNGNALHARQSTDDNTTKSQASCISSQHSRKQRKSVTFDERRNMYIRSAHAQKEYCSDLWYHKADIKRFKASNIELAKGIVDGENGKISMYWRHVLERTYRNVHEEAFESLRAGETEEQQEEFLFSGSILCKSEMKNLKELYSFNKLCPLGIEHLIVESIASDAACRRCEQLDRIYDVEEHIGFPFPGPDFRENMVRMACESLSLGPRLFAKEVAVALAAVVSEEKIGTPHCEMRFETKNSIPKLEDSSLSSSSSSSCLV